MRRLLEIVVVAVVTLGIVSVGFAGCCPPDDGHCRHMREQAGNPSPAASHCGPPPVASVSLEASCCGGTVDESPDYGLSKPLPLPGAPEARAATPQISASTSDASHVASVPSQRLEQRSPVLRL